MFDQVLATEVIKLRRSKAPWATLGVLAIMPLGIALFMWIAREPGRAAQLGLLGTKASLTGIEATWPAYFYMLTLVFDIAGMLLLTFIVAYVFGREYSDASAKNLLSLPVGRHWFAVAKLLVAAVWWMALVAIVIVEAMSIGLAMELPGFSVGQAATGIVDLLLAAAISFLLAPVVAWIAVWSRGEVAPIAFSLVMLALGTLFGKTGWAEWFPHSIVPLLVGMVADPVDSLPAGSYIVLAGTFAAGVAATILQLRFAENGQQPGPIRHRSARGCAAVGPAAGCFRSNDDDGGPPAAETVVPQPANRRRMRPQSSGP